MDCLEYTKTHTDLLQRKKKAKVEKKNEKIRRSHLGERSYAHINANINTST